MGVPKDGPKTRRRENGTHPAGRHVKKGGFPMKKTLALALALVLAFSLAVSSASAADFTDKADIQYQEAVDVIAALGIISGYSDGSFGPANNLTRGAASKIICNLILTPAIASSAINTGSTRFTDVPNGSVYSGFVSYCSTHGIVSGYSDGSFHPYDIITGNAYLKMLLGVLGYDQTIEGYSGSGWSNNVRIQAQQIGLIDASFNGTGAINRELACLLAFRALQADEVEYSGTTRNSRSFKSANASSVSSISADARLQFAEDHFSGLTRNDAYTDPFGRPGTRWSLGGDEVGVYLDSANRTYYTDVAVSQIYSDLKLSSSISDISIYVNGEAAPLSSNASISATNSNPLSALISGAAADKINNNGNGNGTEIHVFRDGSAVTISAISYYAGVVDSVETAASGRYAVIKPAEGTDSAGVNTPNAAFNAASDAWHYAASSLNAGDPVAYTYAENNGIQTVIALGSRTGTLNSKAAGSSLRLGSQTYSYSNMAAFGGSLNGSESSLTIGRDYTVYLLNLGGTDRILWVTNVAAASADGYALVTMLRAGDAMDNTPARARLLFTDGSFNNVTLDRVSLSGSGLKTVATDENVEDYYLVSYRVTNGAYTLSPVPDDSFATSPSFTLRSGAAAFGGAMVNGAGAEVSLTANNSTRFVILVNGAYRAYTGYRAIPNVTDGGAAFAYYTADNSGANIAQAVFVTGGTITTTNRALTFISARSASAVTQDDTAQSDYRTFKAVVNGQITTLRVEVDSESANLGRLSADGSVSYKQDDCALYSVTYSTSDNVIFDGEYDSSGTAVYYSGSNTVKSISASEITLSGAPVRRTGSRDIGGTLDLAPNVNAYVVDAKGNISAVAPRSIPLGSGDTALFTYDLDNNQINNLFILKAN